MPFVKFYNTGNGDCIGSLSYLVVPRVGETVSIPDSEGFAESYFVVDVVYELARKHNSEMKAKVYVK